MKVILAALLISNVFALSSFAQAPKVRKMPTKAQATQMQPPPETRPKGRIFNAPLFGTEGKGGGVLDITSGVYTFGGYEFHFRQKPLTTEEVPGLDLAIKTIRTLSLPPVYQRALMWALQPSEYREYYRISPTSSGAYQKALEGAKVEYNAILNDKFKSRYEGAIIEIALLHSGSVTLLMPEFSRLQDFEGKVDTISQAALLIHEAFRYLMESPNAPKDVGSTVAQLKLEDLIEIQMGIESFLRDVRPMSVFFTFRRLLHMPWYPLKGAMILDRDISEVSKLMKGNQYFNFTQFIDLIAAKEIPAAKARLWALLNDKINYDRASYTEFPYCDGVDLWKEKYPKSRFFQLISTACLQKLVLGSNLFFGPENQEIKVPMYLDLDLISQYKRPGIVVYAEPDERKSHGGSVSWDLPFIENLDFGRMR